MTKGLTAKKFAEWEAYAQIEPFNEMREDYRSASIRQMIFNMAVDPKDRRPLNDFLLDWKVEEPAKPITKEQRAKKQFQLLELYARAVGGVNVVEGKHAEDSRMNEQLARARAAMKET